MSRIYEEIKNLTLKKKLKIDYGTEQRMFKRNMDN